MQQFKTTNTVSIPKIEQRGHFDAVFKTNHLTNINNTCTVTIGTTQLN